MSKTLNVIKRNIALLTLDIECLDPASKYSAIVHLEETIVVLKIGAEHDLETLANQNLTEEKQETKDKWMINNDTFVDESNNETFPVHEREDHHEDENNTCQELFEKVLHQIPNNEVKQEPVNQEPVVISLNPGTYHGQIASENDILKCEPCNVYLPRSYTMKRHAEDPHHLARVSRDSVNLTDKMSVFKSPEISLKHKPNLTEQND